MGIREIAKGVAAARAAGGGNNLNPGKGELIIKKLFCDKLYAGDTFVAEMLVAACEPFPGTLDENQKPKPAGNVVGSTASFVQQFDKFKETAFGNTKAFILELMGEDDQSLADAAAKRAVKLAAEGKLAPGSAWTADDEFALAFEQLCSQANPARGMRVRYSTFEKPSKKGKILTLVRWEHVEQTGEQIAAERARLDGADAVAAAAK